MNYFKHALSIIILLSFISVKAQIIQTGTLKGSVKSNSETLIAAVITCEQDSAYTCVSDVDGNFVIKNITPGNYTFSVTYIGYKEKIFSNTIIEPDKTNTLEIILTEKEDAQSELLKTNQVVSGISANKNHKGKYLKSPRSAHYRSRMPGRRNAVACPSFFWGTSDTKVEEFNTESYSPIKDNGYKNVKEDPLSTFSIDVDNASYTNSRRYINNGNLPPQDAVRIEEFINYFNYQYPQPSNEHPFEIYMEHSICPWNNKHQLIHLGIQGKKIPFEQLKPMNLVFLVDVSGSMSSENKLPLVQKSLILLVDKMRPQDRIAIVVYAGAAGLVLPSTPASNKSTIFKAIAKLQAGGSTAGGEGIQLAYKIAEKNMIPGTVSRVILATDGDFNVGVSSDGEMTRLIEKKRETGIYLTVLGYGMGNYKDSKMETIADNGNGNYFYIDNINESKKVLVDEMDGTLYTIAKDVKIQVEFNPTKIKSFRLIGYENRELNKEDFEDDKKDAGELGAGHTVTALYEVIPVDSEEEVQTKTVKLKYQQEAQITNAANSDEILTVKFRYKLPNDNESKLITKTLHEQLLPLSSTSNSFRFSASVAEFGMLLRDSKFKGNASFENVVELATIANIEGNDEHISEFVKLVKTASLLNSTGQKLGRDE